MNLNEARSTKDSKVVHFAELDGLRFFAFLSVFLAHSFYSKIAEIQAQPLYLLIREYAHLGIYGVNFFFVLSGFLITFLLLKEKSDSGTISVKKFYMRRILRIWPLYFTVISIGFVAVPWSQHLVGNTDYFENAALWPYLLFINNFFPEPSTAILGVLWSIAVEEQFYAFWPLIVLYLPRKMLLPFFLSTILFSLIWRTFIIESWGYSHSLSCMSDLCVGALLAYLIFFNSEVLSSVIAMKRAFIALIYAFGFGMFLFREEFLSLINSKYYYLNERLVFSVFFAFVIYEQCFCKNSLFKMSKLKLVSSLGGISYGLYMLHFCSIYVVSKALSLMSFNTQLYQVLLIEPLLSLIFTILIGKASFRYLEQPFLSLKQKFGSYARLSTLSD